MQIMMIPQMRTWPIYCRKKLHSLVWHVTHAPSSLGWIILIALVANTMAFTARFATSTIIADAWYFLDTFVRKAVTGTLVFSDFFAKRGGFDHAQPLKKILLLIELRHFHLDFRVGAIFGVLFAIVSVLIMHLIVRWENNNQANTKTWLWVMICTTVFSLNSAVVWTWGLVSSGYMFYALAFAMLAIAWRRLITGKWFLFITWALLINIAGDDRALIVNIACIIALTYTGWRIKTYRWHTCRAVIELVVCYIVVRIGYALIFTPPQVHGMAIGIRFHKLAEAFLHGGWHEWVLVPLSESIIYSVRLTSYPLAQFVGEISKPIQLTLGALLLVGHLWFWRIAWKHEINIQRFSAIIVMLIFYAFVAGIIWARIPVFGNSFLHQSRYVLLYNFGNIALLLMCSGANWADTNRSTTTSKAMTFLAVAFLVLQIPLSWSSWMRGPWIAQYHEKVAQQIWYIDKTHHVPDHCLPELVICKYPAQKRHALIQLLQKYKLNVFSSSFQRANRLYPPHSTP